MKGVCEVLMNVNVTKNYQAFYDDKFVPIFEGLTSYEGTTVANIEERLRYLAETILLFLGDELPDSEKSS